MIKRPTDLPGASGNMSFLSRLQPYWIIHHCLQKEKRYCLISGLRIISICWRCIVECGWTSWTWGPGDSSDWCKTGKFGWYSVTNEKGVDGNQGRCNMISSLLRLHLRSKVAIERPESPSLQRASSEVASQPNPAVPVVRKAKIKRLPMNVLLQYDAQDLLRKSR